MPARDDSGQFAKGNPGGPGRPKKEREERFYEITLTVVTFEDWKSIVWKAVADAKRGDAVARKFLADYLMGPPVQRQEVTGANGEAIVLKVVKGVSVDDL